MPTGASSKATFWAKLSFAYAEGISILDSLKLEEAKMTLIAWTLLCEPSHGTLQYSFAPDSRCQIRSIVFGEEEPAQVLPSLKRSCSLLSRACLDPCDPQSHGVA